MNKIKKMTIELETRNKDIFPEYFLGIKNIEELKDKYKLKSGKINGIYKPIIKKFEEITINNIEGIDGIEYLYKLYYIEQKSLRDCINKIKEEVLEISIESKQLSNIMKKNLGWKLRGRTEETSSKLKKDQNKKNNAKILNTSELVEELLGELTQKPIDYKIIDAVKEKKQKVMYFLNNIGLLDKKTKKDFSIFLKKYLEEKNISLNTMAKILNEVIYKSRPPYDFKINAGNIGDWKKVEEN